MPSKTIINKLNNPFGLCLLLVSCTNGSPQIQSLNLSTSDLSFVQAQQSTSDLVGNSEGEFEFEVKCAQGMTSLQYSNQADGPWIELAPINCQSGSAKVTFFQQSHMSEAIYLRTKGSWGQSEAHRVNLFSKMKVDLTGLPPKYSNQTDFTITVKGEKLESYRFGFGKSETQDCSQQTLYGEERSVNQPILASDLNYSFLTDGNYRLCIISKSKYGLWSRGEFAESRDWLKDTVAQPAMLTRINSYTLVPGQVQFQSNIEAPMLELKVDNDEESTIRAFSDTLCSVELASAKVNHTKALLYLPKDKLLQGINEIYLQTIDLAANKSSCVKTVSYYLDSVSPQILSISGFTKKTYGVGEVLTFDVNLSEALTWDKVVASPTLKLRAEGTLKDAIFIESQSTPTKLHFEYQVKLGDNDGDGITLVSPLTIPDSIKLIDAAKNPLKSDLTIADTQEVKIDTTAPSILSVTASSTDTWVKAGETITFNVNFSEPCKFTGASNLQLPLQVNNNGVYATCPIPANYTNLLSCKYTVLSDQVDSDGVSINAATLSLTGNITDLTLNNANLALPTTNFPTLKVDASKPSVVGINLVDGTISTSLTASPPITWNSSSDVGSGLNNYTLQVVDGFGNLVYSQSYANAQTNLVLTGLSLADLTNATNQYQTYVTKVIISDIAGNQSVVTSDGWRVIQFTQGTDVNYANSNDLFGSALAVSADGLRMLVTVKNLRLVKVYAYNPSSEGWNFQSNINDPIGSDSNFGSALGILKLSTDSYLYAVGAPGDASSKSGAVIIFRDDSGTVIPSQTLKNTTPQDDDEFGKSLDFLDEFLVIGSPGHDTILASDSGLIVSFTCPRNSGTCAQTGGGLGYEIDHGILSNQRLGDLVTATMQGGTPTLYASKSALQLSRYIYSDSDMTWLQINCTSGLNCTLWSSGPAMTYLDSFNNTIVASNGSSDAKISVDGDTFNTLTGTTGNVGPIGVIGDLSPTSSSNIGTFIVAYDSAGSTTRFYKPVGTTNYYLKQSTSGSNFSGGSFAGSGAKLLLGSPAIGKILFFK